MFNPAMLKETYNTTKLRLQENPMANSETQIQTQKLKQSQIQHPQGPHPTKSESQTCKQTQIQPQKQTPIQTSTQTSNLWASTKLWKQTWLKLNINLTNKVPADFHVVAL